MELYHGSSHTNSISGVLNHFGNFSAAADVIESNFANTPHRLYNGSDFLEVDYYGTPMAFQSLESTIEDFIAHASSSVIRKYEADISTPLRLFDCWTDDPIGSGGLKIFSNSGLPRDKQAELRELFSPFESIIYPQHVYSLLTQQDILSILNNPDPVFIQEMRKRENRSSIIGEDFAMAAGHEAIWVHLTIKLRQWAIDNNFDSFVYSNSFEGTDEPTLSDSYVTFATEQINETQTYRFNAQKYRDIVPAGFKRYLDKITENKSGEMLTGVYWAGHSPAQFWEAKQTL